MTDTIYIIILLVMGLGVAYMTSRATINREKLQGGTASKALNYLASGLIAMLAPTVLCNVFFIHPDFMGTIAPFGWNITAFAHAIVIALTMMGIALLLLIVLASLEKPFLDKLEPKEDKGWTKEDAETSGL